MRSLFPTPYKYVLDSSALFDFKRNYPPDVFKSVWANFESLINQRAIISVREVYNEIKRGSDWLIDWADERKDIFLIPETDEINYVGELQAKYPNLVDYFSTKPAADPFVIACAKMNELIIIQHEKLDNKKQKIPFVAKAENVQCVTLTELFKLEGWTF